MLRWLIMKKSLIVLLLCFIIILLLPACGEKHIQLVNLTILHTNDTRSHLDNMPRRATIIDQVRSEIKGDNVLLLDAGDIFSGTPYFTLYQGQADLWFMNYLNYDAVCLGNHEFDYGPTVLSNFVSQVNFPVLAANVDVAKEKSLAGKIVPWVIIQTGQERYGVLGLTTPDTAEIANPGSTIVFSDYIAAAKKAVSALEARGINKIIAITHIGWENDLKLASSVKGIDIIIGGHSGIVPSSYPVIVETEGLSTLVVQAGENGKYIGRLNVKFDAEGNVQLREGSELIELDDTVDEDPVCLAKLEEYKTPISNLEKTVIGQTVIKLDGNHDTLRSYETNLGNLVADAVLAKAAKSGALIALWNSGSIRTSIPAGDVSLGQVMAVLPFNNRLVTLDLTGDQILAALENGVSQVEVYAGRFPVVAGLRFTWDPKGQPGTRVKSVEIKTATGYKPITKDAIYRVVTNNFLASGGDGYTIFLSASRTINLGFADYYTLAEYITAHSPINPQVEGRIIRTQ